MNKTALAIQMLEILNSGGRKSRKDIADRLEITERKVIDLKQELEVAGYLIESSTGKFGGYRLISENILPALNLTNDEKAALNHASGYLKDKTDFLFQKDFERVVEKMKVVSNTQYQHSAIIYQKYENLSKTLQKEIKKMESSILSQHRIIIDYIGLNAQTIQNYEVEPYWIVFFEEAYYLIGYVVNRKAFRTFKIVKQRLKKIHYTNDYFYRENYRLNDMIGQLHLVKQECFEIQFEAYDYVARLLYEKGIGLNDEKVWVDRNTLQVTTIVESETKIKQLILSFGNKIKVIYPTAFKNRIIQSLKESVMLYDNDSKN